MLPRLVPRAARGAARRCGAGLRRLLSESAPARLPVEVTRVTTLSNGLRVATERVHAECETVTLGVWFDCGSRYEAVENNGAAHFLEHIAFKGTRRRSQYQLEKAIEDMGAHLNAYTSREQTVYYARLFKADVAQGMDVLADILQHSLIDTQAVEKERGTILREMEEVYKNHEERVLDLLHEAAYKDGGLGRTILGPEENIKRITAPDLRAYIETHYTAPRTVIVAAGAVDHDEIVALSEKYWSNLPEASRTDFAVDFEPAKFTPEEVRLPDEAEPRTHIGIAFDGASWTSEYSVPLMVLQTLVGQWDRMNPVAGGAETSPFKLARTLAREDAAHLYLSFNTCYHDGASDYADVRCGRAS